jgi:tetratricopeptide (TPR) repeat protein
VSAGERDRIRDSLATQSALEQGLEQIQRGRFAEAVAILEKRIALIDGNRRYLIALRDAYRGYIKQLEAENRTAELKLYRGRLAILEPPGRATAVSAVRGENTADTAVAPRTATAVARGVSRDEPPAPASDPFAESNRAPQTTHSPDQRARRLVEQAERAFELNQYDSAGQLFEQAHRLAPASVDACRERWGYCRLTVAAQVVNFGPVDRLPGLEREVREALTLAPRLDGFARKVLTKLSEVNGANLNIRHTPRQGSGWAMAATSSIRVYHATNQETAEKVIRIAEATRLVMMNKWFGEGAADWSPPCTIYLHPTAQSYAKGPGGPTTIPGYATIKQDSGRIIERRIDLRGDDPSSLTTALPHEATHVVLAGRFGQHYLPRWADEGMAVLSEPCERVELYLRNLPATRDEGTLFSVQDLLAVDKWPESRRMTAFYAQSVSLVDFLCKKKGTQAFARFLHQALDGRDFARALQQHYGYRSLADLERDWKQHALGSATAVTLSEKQR